MNSRSPGRWLSACLIIATLLAAFVELAGAQQLAVARDSIGLQVGDTSRVVATLRGAPAGARLAYTGTDAAVFTQHRDGRITARGAGCAYARISYGTWTRAQVRVCVAADQPAPAPIPQPQPDASNRPAGLATRVDWDWPTHVNRDLRIWYEPANGIVAGANQAVVRADGVNVLQATYAPMSAPGYGTGRTNFGLPGEATELYISFPHRFQPEYVSSTNSNKLFFVMFGNERAFLGYIERGGQRSVNLTLSSFGPTPNVALPSTSQIPYGRWVRWEWYLRRNTPGRTDGVMRVWMDGRLIHEQTALAYPGAWTAFYVEGVHNGVNVEGVSGRRVPCACWWQVGRVTIAAR